MSEDRPGSVAVGPGIVRRVVVDGERMMVCEFILEREAVFPPHSHPHEQVGYVASGRIRLTVEGRTVEIGPGGGYRAAPGALHGAVALERSVVVDTFSPPREDYR